jgi:hypothetical protein
MHNILPNINYRPRFVINRVVTLYVSITGGLSMSDEYSSIKKQSITKYYVFTLFQITFSTHFKIQKEKLANKILTIMHSKDLAQIMTCPFTSS